MAGTVIGSGTVANQGSPDGSCCLAEVRCLETIADGKPSTPFMSVGDRIEIEMKDEAGRSIAVVVLRHGQSGQWISARLPLLYGKADMQGLKSALTYATRMLTQILTGCASAESEDDGNVASQPKATAKPVQQMEESARGLRKIREGTEQEARDVLSWAEDAAEHGRIKSSVLDAFRRAFEERFAKEVANV